MIIGVAVKFKGGLEVRLPKPNRHSDCFELAISDHEISPTDCVGSHGQGFYSCDGTYLTRKDAMSHVRATGQELLPDWRDGDINNSEYLTSEDVW